MNSIKIEIKSGISLTVNVLRHCFFMTFLSFYRRKATPVKNTENIQAAERKEDQNAAVMSYSSLNDGTSNRMYENVPEDGLYDSPYSGSGSTYG